MRIRLTTAAAAIGVCAVIAACGDSDAGSGPLIPTISPSTSSPSSSASASSPPAATSPPTPSVPPATGKLLNGPVATMRIPRGWKTESGAMAFQLAFSRDDIDASGQLSELGLGPSGNPEATPAFINQEAKHYIKTERATGLSFRRLPDLEIDGLPAFHIRARDSGFEVNDIYYTRHRDHGVEINLDWDTDYASAAQRQRLTDSMLATLELK